MFGVRLLKLLFVLTLLAPAIVHADDAPPLGRAGMDDELLRYYGQERTTAIIATSVGIAAAGAGGYLVTRHTDFDRGLGIPLLSLGALEGIGAIFYVFQVNSEVDHYRALLASDPTSFRSTELTHLHGTTSRFTYYRAAELALTVAGIGFGTYGFIADKETFKGLGIGLAALGAPLLVIDTFNNASAGRYIENLERFQPSLAVGRTRDGWMLALSTNF